MPKRISEARKKAYKIFVRNKALLGFFVRHPDKMNDKPTIDILTTLAAKQADAYIAFRDPKSVEAEAFKTKESKT